MYEKLAAYLFANRDHRVILGRSADEIIEAPEGTTGFWVGIERRDDHSLWFDATGETIDEALGNLDAECGRVLAGEGSYA